MWTDDRKLARLAIVLAALLSFYQYWVRDITYFDEPRYAGIAREMSEESSFAIPLLYGEQYTEKPPLWFWATAACGRVLGFSSAAYFLPNVLAHFLTALLLLDLGRRAASLTSGALAALGFAACPLAIHYARSAQLDPLLAFGVTLCSYGALRALSERRFACGLLAAVGFAIASLIKGHIAFFGLIAPLAWCATHRDWSWLRRPWWALLFAVLALLPFAGWFALVIRELGYDEAIRIYVHRQVVERSAGGNHYSPIPIGPEYLAGLALMLPLSLFLPRALALAKGDAWKRTFAITAITIFSIFAVIPSKREIYLEPLVPWVALVVGDHLALVLRGVRSEHRFERGVTVGFAALLGVAAIGLPIGIGYLLRDRLASIALDGVALMVAGSLAALATLRAWKAKDSSAAPRLLLQLGVVFLFAEPLLARAANSRFTTPRFGEAVQAAVPEADSILIFGFTKAHAEHYFARRDFEFVDDLAAIELAAVTEGEAWVMTDGDGAKKLKRAPELAWEKICDDDKPFEEAKILYKITPKSTNAPSGG